MKEKRTGPIDDPGTCYHIEVRGWIDPAWLQSFDASAQIHAREQEAGLTVLEVRTDQAGVVGLLRRLHELGISIHRFQVVSEVEG